MVRRRRRDRKKPAKSASLPRKVLNDTLFDDRPKIFSLIPTDRGPILADWRERYRALESELTAVSSLTEEYHFRAVPEYQAWVSREFGEELSALREIDEKIREFEILVLATVEEARRSDSPEDEAYRIVLLRVERGEDLFFPSEEDWEEGWAEVDPERDYREEIHTRRENSRSQEEDKENKEKDADEASRRYFRDLRSSAELADAEAEADASRLKSLYRKLAFALHPDANPNQSSRDREIWMEVQTAYIERDMERLEVLSTWIEAGSEGWLDRIDHAGTLRTLVMEKFAELRSTRSSFNRLKKETPWRYWTARESESRMDRFREGIEQAFLHDLLLGQRRLREFDLQFRRWLGGNPRKKGKKKPRPT